MLKKFSKTVFLAVIMLSSVQMTWATPTPVRPRSVVILAAGLGSRMQSVLPKVLHQLEGKPMIFHILTQVNQALPDAPIALVVGYKKELIETYVKSEPELEKMNISYIFQETQKGTGHATRCAIQSSWGQERLRENSQILILPGDLPLVTKELVSGVTDALDDNAALRLLTCHLDQPTGYGRVVRNPESGSILKIVEEKDATPKEKEIREVALSTYLFDAKFLNSSIQSLNTNNKQGEYYLTDLIEEAIQQNKEVPVLVWPNQDDVRNVNSQLELKEARDILHKRLHPSE